MDVRALVWSAAVALLVGTGCASVQTPASQVPGTSLIAPGGSSVDVRQLVAEAPFTVLIFFSRDCHCLDQHDARIRELYDAYRPHHVQLLMVDSEVRASLELDAAEAVRRGYGFPILIDRAAKLAAALGAEYATYSVVVDAQGRVRYRGGFDSDKTHLRETATPYLRNALDDQLAGLPPRLAEAKTLGCALEKW